MAKTASKKTPKAQTEEVQPVVETTSTPEVAAVETKKAPVEKAAAPKAKAKTMADLLAAQSEKLVVPQRGTPVTGTITAITRKALVVDIGGKTEAVVTDKEFDMARDYISTLEVGQSIEAQVFSGENTQGQVLLSLKQAALDSRWDYFADMMAKGEILEAKGVDVNKGGLIVVVNNVRGFVPSSQFSKTLVGKFATLRGKSIDVKVIEVDREKNRLIFSERHVSEADEIAQKSQAVDAVKVNEIYEGVVSGVMPFGLFVTVEVPVEGTEKKETLGQVEGLVHISEISWEKVSHPKDYHKVGDRIKVRVLGLDERTGKLNLSIKQLSEDPWVKVGERYEVGMSVTGTVSRIEPFGAFINVEQGVDGLIHSSKLDGQTQLKKGDSVTVNVESVDPVQRRMSLSLVLTELPMGYK
ncbi:S1 RNA-binding domain-containing protein [Candidatus Woesebacteria bacterium]|nr:S1 RNA-binding domain-containing protein [Candidatus Woesebacteria bacterium]